MTSFHVSLIFDALILAREAKYVNIAYYPNRKTGKSGHFYDIDKIYSPEGKFFLCMPFYLAESGEKK